jgi:hypothetical protein
MAADLTNYSGNFFKNYAKDIIDTFPAPAVIQSRIDVGESEKVGEEYVVPISVAWPGGVTYSANRGRYAIETGIDGEMKNIRLQPCEHVMRVNLSYGAIEASQKSDTAAKEIVGRIGAESRDSIRRAIEEDFLYGQYSGGLGVVESADNSAKTVTLTAATFAGAMWQKKKNHLIDILTSTFSAAHLAAGKLVSCTVSTRTLKFDAAVNLSSVIPGDVLFMKNQVTPGGTPAYNTSPGLILQCSNTTLNLFSLDPTTNDVMQGNSLPTAGDVFSFDWLNQGIALTQDRGNEEPKMTAFISNSMWGRLNSDIGANRRLDGSYTKMKYEEGVRGIVYHCAMGDIEIISHPLMIPSLALLFSFNDIKRPGTTDVTFHSKILAKQSNRGNMSGLMLEDDPDFTSVYYKLFHESSLLHRQPAHAVLFTGLDPAG